MDGKIFLAAFSAAALAFTLSATTYTSASYVQSGLIAQWDGIDNQGTGTHDPTATTWKDLNTLIPDFCEGEGSGHERGRTRGGVGAWS